MDCVVVVDDEDHNEFHQMSYTTPYSPVLTGELKSPVEDAHRMKLNERKVIARRASRALKPGQIVNLGKLVNYIVCMAMHSYLVQPCSPRALISSTERHWAA